MKLSKNYLITVKKITVQEKGEKKKGNFWFPFSNYFTGPSCVASALFAANIF